MGLRVPPPPPQSNFLPAKKCCVPLRDPGKESHVRRRYRWGMGVRRGMGHDHATGQVKHDIAVRGGRKAKGALNVRIRRNRPQLGNALQVGRGEGGAGSFLPEKGPCGIHRQGGCTCRFGYVQYCAFFGHHVLVHFCPIQFLFCVS